MKKLNPVFVAACSGMLIFGITMTTFGSVLPDLMNIYGINKLTAGTIASTMSAGLLIGSLAFGPLADRYGFKNLLIINVVFVVAGLELLAFGGTRALLFPAVFLIGTGGGILNGGTGALVADISDRENKGSNLTILSVFFGLGALGMPSVLSFFRNFMSINSILAITGAVIATFVIYMALIKFPPAKHAEGLSIKDAIKLLKSSSILIAGGILLFAAGAESLMANWLSTYLNESKGLSIGKSLYFLSFYMATFTLARIIISIVLKKFSAIKLNIFLAFIGVLGCIALLSGNTIAGITGIVLMAAGFSPTFPIIMAYVAELFSKYSGTAFSVILSIGLIGNMSINYIMGFLSEKYSPDLFPIIAGISAILVLLNLLLFKKIINQKL